MVKYELVYFHGMGRAEVARLLFAQAEVEYVDKRVEREDWPALKPTSPTGQVPYLVEGGFKLGQSMAIARYLAREFGLYGASSREAAEIDCICDTVSELRNLAVKTRFAPDQEAKEEAIQSVKDKAPALFKVLNNAASKSSSGFLVGDKVSLADIVVFQDALGIISLEVFSSTLKEEFKKMDKLMANHEKVANLPKIKEWIAKRPQTPF